MSVTAISSALAYQRPAAAGKSAEASASESGGGSASGGNAQAPAALVSPVLRYDQGARVAVLYFRDFDTGETRDQIPAKRVVEKYRQSGGRSSETETGADTATSSTRTQTAPSASGSVGSAPATVPSASTTSFVSDASTVSPASTVSVAPAATVAGAGGAAASFSSVSISV